MTRARCYFKSFLHSFFEFRWLILFFMAIVLLGTVAVVFRWPDEFTAKIHLRVDSSEPSLLPSRIKDSSLIDKAVESLKLDEYFGTSAREAAQILRQRVISVRFISEEQIWVVSVTAESPRIANQIVDAIVYEYIRSSFEERLKTGESDLPLWGETIARMRDRKFQSSQKIAAFFEHNIHKEIAELPFLQDLDRQLIFMEQERAPLAEEDPHFREISREIQKLRQTVNKEKQRLREAARENIQQAQSAVDIEILERISSRNRPSGPGRMFWIYFNGVLSAGFIFLGIILRVIRGR